MPIDKKAVQDRLKQFDLAGLFTQELGWEVHAHALFVTLHGQTFALTALAHKRGMVAYHCPASAGQPLPDYPTRCKIEQDVSKSAMEHLIIFTDAGQSMQIWQWVKREAGKPLARREHTFHRSQSGEALTQKLLAIAFTIEEEESVTLPDVTGRVRAGFDIERVTKAFYIKGSDHSIVYFAFVFTPGWLRFSLTGSFA